MKHVLTGILFMLCLALPLAADAGEKRRVILVDNSVIVGEIVSMSGGVYTIMTDNLGLLEIADSKVKSIGNNTSQAINGDTSSNLNEISGITQKMTTDSSIMQQILVLQNDPDFQEILQDETVMRAIHSGDLNALMNNPKIMKLIENAGVQQIGREIQ